MLHKVYQTLTQLLKLSLPYNNYWSSSRHVYGEKVLVQHGAPLPRLSCMAFLIKLSSDSVQEVTSGLAVGPHTYSSGCST